MLGHPLGELMWRHTIDCPLRAHEDSRQMADADLLRARRTAQRPATATERTLLAAAGHVLGDAELVTHVEAATPSLIRRRWPTLEPEPGSAA